MDLRAIRDRLCALSLMSALVVGALSAPGCAPSQDPDDGSLATVALALAAPPVGDFTLLELKTEDGDTLFERKIESAVFRTDLQLPIGPVIWTAGLYEGDGTPIVVDTGVAELEPGVENVIDIELVIESVSETAGVEIGISVNQAPTLVAGGIFVEGLLVTALAEFVDPDLGPVQVAMAGPEGVPAERGEVDGFEALQLLADPLTTELFYVTAVGVDFPENAATVATWAVQTVDDRYESVLVDKDLMDAQWRACQDGCLAEFEACTSGGFDTDDGFINGADTPLQECAEIAAECTRCDDLQADGVPAAEGIGPRFTRNLCPTEAIFELTPEVGSEDPTPLFVMPLATELDFPNLDAADVFAVIQEPAEGTTFIDETTFIMQLDVLGEPDADGNSPILDSCTVPTRIIDGTAPVVTMELDFGALTIGGSPDAALFATDTSSAVVETGFFVNGEPCPDASEHVYEPGMVCIQAFAIDAAGNEGRSTAQCEFVESRIPAFVITDFLDDYECIEGETLPDGSSTGASLNVQLEVTPASVTGEPAFGASEMMGFAELQALDINGEPIGKVVSSLEEDPGFPSDGIEGQPGSYARGNRARYAFQIEADGGDGQEPTLSACPHRLQIRGFALAGQCVLDWKGEAFVLEDGPVAGCDEETCGPATPLLSDEDLEPGMTRPGVGADQSNAAVLSLCGIAGLGGLLEEGVKLAGEALAAAEKAAAEADCWDTCDLRVTSVEKPAKLIVDDPVAKTDVCLFQPLNPGVLILFPELALRKFADSYASSRGGAFTGVAAANNPCLLGTSVFSDAGTVTTKETYTSRIVCPGKKGGACGGCCKSGWEFMCKHKTEFRARAVAQNSGQATAAAAFNVTGSCDPQRNLNGVTTDIQIVKGKVGGKFKGALKVDESGKAVPTAEAEFNADFEYRYLDPDTALAGRNFRSTDNPTFKVIKAENCETEFALEGGVELVHALALRPFLATTSANASIEHATADLNVRARCGEDSPIPDSLRWDSFIQVVGDPQTEGTD